MSTQSPFEDIGNLSIVNEKALQNGDMCFTEDELDQFSYPMLRNLAAHAETDEINGKSNKLEIRSYFRCQRSLREYE